MRSSNRPHREVPLVRNHLAGSAGDCGSYTYRSAVRWPSGRRRRFAKPLYGLKAVSRVRIPASPPISALAKLAGAAGLQARRASRVRSARAGTNPCLTANFRSRGTCRSGRCWSRPPSLARGSMPRQRRLAAPRAAHPAPCLRSRHAAPALSRVAPAEAREAEAAIGIRRTVSMTPGTLTIGLFARDQSPHPRTAFRATSRASSRLVTTGSS